MASRSSPPPLRRGTLAITKPMGMDVMNHLTRAAPITAMAVTDLATRLAGPAMTATMTTEAVQTRGSV